LEPLRIGVKAGTTTYRCTKKEFEGSIVIGYQTTDEIREAFFKNKIDAIVHEDPYVRAFQARFKKKRGQFVALTKPVSKEGLAVAYRYGDEDFARFLDGYIRYLHESGTFEKWKKQYFDDAAWMGGAK
jgi:ABC-type amino acid transport substrate-binding protein